MFSGGYLLLLMICGYHICTTQGKKCNAPELYYCSNCLNLGVKVYLTCDRFPRPRYATHHTIQTVSIFIMENITRDVYYLSDIWINLHELYDVNNRKMICKDGKCELITTRQTEITTTTHSDITSWTENVFTHTVHVKSPTTVNITTNQTSKNLTQPFSTLETIINQPVLNSSIFNINIIYLEILLICTLVIILCLVFSLIIVFCCKNRYQTNNMSFDHVDIDMLPPPPDDMLRPDFDILPPPPIPPPIAFAETEI